MEYRRIMYIKCAVDILGRLYANAITPFCIIILFEVD